MMTANPWNSTGQNSDQEHPPPMIRRAIDRRQVIGTFRVPVRDMPRHRYVPTETGNKRNPSIATQTTGTTVCPDIETNRDTPHPYKGCPSPGEDRATKKD